jgi:hypothetical protein
MGMTVAIFRSLIGPERFDAMIKRHKERYGERSSRVPFWDDSPRESASGMSIEEGRQALHRAADRNYKLP